MLVTEYRRWHLKPHWDISSLPQRVNGEDTGLASMKEEVGSVKRILPVGEHNRSPA